MIYTELNENNFAYELSKNKDNGFSYEGANIIYDLFTNIGGDIEFDEVAIRCDYVEYASVNDFIRDYDCGDYKEWIEDNNLEFGAESESQYFNEVIIETDHFVGGSENCYIMSNY